MNIKPIKSNKGTWTEETKRNDQIITLSKVISQTAIAALFGISRQRVNQIIQRSALNKKRRKKNVQNKS